jgi:hypothetical protein
MMSLLRETFDGEISKPFAKRRSLPARLIPLFPQAFETQPALDGGSPIRAHARHLAGWSAFHAKPPLMLHKILRPSQMHVNAKRPRIGSMALNSA